MIGGNTAHAEESAGQPCRAKADIATIAALETALSDPNTFNCDPVTAEPEGGDWTLRFDISASQARPQILYTRLGDFDRLSLSIKTTSGEWYQKELTLADMKPSVGEPYIHADLPEYNGNAEVIFASFKGNGHGPTLTRARLLEKLPGFDETSALLLIGLAALIGVMLVPLALNAAFFMVLRQSFLAWHVVLSLSFAALLIFRSGIFGLVFEMNAEWWRIAMIMSTAVTIAASLMFTRAYIEPGKLSPLLIKWIPYMAVLGLVVSAIHSASFEVLRPLGGNFHSIGMAIPLLFMVAAMVDAVRRGSRAIRFQVVGWLPLIVGSFIRIITHVFPIGLQTDAFAIFYFGILSEGLGTALGVADRFMILKRERDAARTEARMMEQLSERDPLTGLMNRRAIDTRFTDLHRAGYETFALIDLDNFKRVNDTEGHAVGDAVLKIVAQALIEEEDAIAIRLGGEEFFLLIKGADAAERAEKLRQSIPIRIAGEVAELSQLVTASMGLVVAPNRAMPNANFSDVYTRSDTLLYEAKEQGRNRTVSEKMQAFHDRRQRGDRRKPKASTRAA